MNRGEPDPSLPPHRASALESLVPSLRLMVGLVIAALIIAGLYFGRTILVPLALAFLLSFVLAPPVERLKRLRVPDVAAVLAVVLATLLVLGAGATLVANEARALSAELPSYQSTIRGKLRNLRKQMRAPGMFDGAKRTLDIVQREVDAATPAPPAAVQKVQVLPPPVSPAQQAMAALGSVSGPLADAALVLVFVIFILLDRVDLRDRLLRLWGRDLHRATDAMDEAGGRITRYLTMQLLVNVTYGIPLAAGLWFIGVPGALLWGALAAVMRFVPYVGPLISSAFPVALAFAVDPGWSLVLWTIGLIAVLELISNNVVEPWLYGASTGLSAMSLIVSATFWTALWGPVGLVMSTPLTVCLLVVGRYLPQLAFLDVLLGSQPALDEPTRVYQRLLAGDADEAIELSAQQIDAAQGGVREFYAGTGLSVLRMAVGDHARAATPHHRLRVVEGMDELLDELAEQYPPPPAIAAVRPGVACIGGKWEVDQLAARMLAHALQLQGCPAQAHSRGAQHEAGPALDGAQVVCLAWLAPDPAAVSASARHLCRRVKRRWPHVQVVLALLNGTEGLPGEEAPGQFGADAVATSFEEALLCITRMQGASASNHYEDAPVPEGDAARVAALHASGALHSDALAALCQGTVRRAADIFDVPTAMVSLVDAATQHVHCVHGVHVGGDMPRALSLCGHVVAGGGPLVVPDLARDARFAGNPLLRERALRFYAGAPLRDGAGHVLGTLCLMDAAPRSFDEREARLLQAMADDLMASWRGERAPGQGGTDAPPPSAIVGQPVPQ